MNRSLLALISISVFRLLNFSPPALGQSNPLPPDTSGLIQFTIFPGVNPFQSDEAMKISLEFDMKKLIRDKYKNQYQEALLYYREANGDTTFHHLKIIPRGNFRKSYCRFPPIKLNFKESESDQEYLNNINKLKLVTHCQHSDKYQQYLFKEYLVYKMYNLLTDKSFRVKLLRIKYIDSEGRMKTTENHAFIIECNSLLSNRLNATIIDRPNIHTWHTDHYQANLMALFQFMIGNPDWGIPNLQNVRLLKSENPMEKPFAIPYDFDYCGMVNAHYAIPNALLGIETVRTRIYRGYCLSSEEEYQVFFNEFIKVKEEMYALVQNFNLLEEKHRSEMISYLDSFYEIIEDPRLADRKIISVCLEIPSR